MAVAHPSHEWLVSKRADILSGLGADPEFDGKRGWEENHGGLDAICDRSPYDGFEDGFKFREIRIRLSEGARPIAIAKFTEWRRTDPDVAAEDWFYAADGYSRDDADCAIAVNEFWNFQHPLEFGDLARFDRLVIETGLDRHRMAWPALRSAIHREFGRRCAVMVLKAFPIDFSDYHEEIAHAAYISRRMALERLYRRTLGAMSFTGEGIEPGWMWLPLRKRFPRPVGYHSVKRT